MLILLSILKHVVSDVRIIVICLSEEIWNETMSFKSQTVKVKCQVEGCAYRTVTRKHCYWRIVKNIWSTLIPVCSVILNVIKFIFICASLQEKIPKISEPSLRAHFSITKKRKLVQETASSSPKKRNLSGDSVEERQNDETSSRI